MKSYKYLWILLIIFISIILINTYYVKSNYDYLEPKCVLADKKNSEERCIVYRSNPTEQEEIKNHNYIQNQVGYIRIDGTNIDGAIMQYTDNNFYLNHDNSGNYYVYGSIYMDYRNSIDDQKILIFGHNTKGNSISPLHDLEKYENYSFYQEHPYIIMELNGQKNKWHIFSVLVVSNKSNTHMRLKFNDESWTKHLEWLKNNSIYDTNTEVNEKNQVVTIQTCYYGENETFILVSAKKEK